MKMKRKAFILWAAFVMILAAPGAVLAAEVPSIWDSLVPKGDDKVGDVTVEYNRYPLSHYQLEIVVDDRPFWQLDESVSDTGWVILHGFNNMLWQVNVEITRIVIFILEESLKLDVVGELIESVGQGVRSLAGFGENLENRGFYGLLFPILIIGFGGWVGWKALVDDDEDSAVRGLMYFLIVVIFSFSFFYYAEDIGREANRGGVEVSKGVMALATNTFQPTKNLNSEEATAQVGNNLWDMAVIMPYKLIQFGTVEVDDKRVEKLLKTPPDQRDKVLEEEKTKHKNQMLDPRKGWTRLGFVVMQIILNLFALCIPLFIALFKLLYQLWFLFVLLLAPIALAWAIIPSWRETLYKWASELLGAVLMQVALGVLLAIYLAVGGALYQFAEKKGFVIAWLLQIALVVVIIKQRKVIFQLVVAPATFLHWNRAYQSANRLPRWLPTDPSRMMEEFNQKMSKGLNALFSGRGDQGSRTVDEEPSETSSGEPYELKEMEKKPKEEVLFEPYDDPQLKGQQPEQDQIQGSSETVLELDGEQEYAAGLEEEKTALLEGESPKLEVIDAEVVEEEKDIRHIEDHEDTPRLEKPAQEKKDGPILLIEPEKKEGEHDK